MGAQHENARSRVAGAGTMGALNDGEPTMLDELDPVAKAQVAAYVAEAELGRR